MFAVMSREWSEQRSAMTPATSSGGAMWINSLVARLHPERRVSPIRYR